MIIRQLATLHNKRTQSIIQRAYLAVKSKTDTCSNGFKHELLLKMYCLSTFCCVCLNYNKDLLNLNKTDDDNIPIINKLIFIAFGHERLDLDVTKFICAKCLEDLRIAYKFKTTCLTNSEIIFGYNCQLKYFTGVLSENCDLQVKLSENERTLTDKKYQQRVIVKKYKPRPLSKQQKYLLDDATPEKKRFKCRICAESFEKPILRLIHYNKTHANNKCKVKSRQIVPKSEKLTYVCNMCQKSFITSKLLKYHMFKVHFNEANLYCRHCNQRFSARKSFLYHLKYKHDYNNFTCQICNTKYLKELSYNKHMTLHAENKIIKKTHRGGRQKNPAQVANNKKLKMITRYLVCKVCDEIFINSAQLQNHLTTHGNEINSREISSETSEIPLEIKLEPEIEIKEEVSNDFFENNFQAYNFNIESVVSTSTLEQNVGTTEISNNNQLNELDNAVILPNLQNEQTNEQNKYVCHICDKSFTVKSFLNAHLLIHNGAVNATNNFECKNCNIKFINKSEFVDHIITNNCFETKKLSCETCLMTFQSANMLSQHLMTH